MAGWQCVAGRAILRMEASQFAPMAGTTKNTLLRFESGQFMPRPATVLDIDRTFRKHGVMATFTRDGEPRGIVISWHAYRFAYPGQPLTKHRDLDEIAERLRANPPPPVQLENAKGDRAPPKMRDKGVPLYEAKQRETSPRASELQSPQVPAARGDMIDALEAEQRRLIRELERLKEEARLGGDEHDF